MGIKSTRHVDRNMAVWLYVDYKSKIKRRKWEAQAALLNDAELGDALDELSDRVAEAEGTTNFDNFLVVS